MENPWTRPNKRAWNRRQQVSVWLIFWLLLCSSIIHGGCQTIVHDDDVLLDEHDEKANNNTLDDRHNNNNKNDAKKINDQDAVLIHIDESKSATEEESIQVNDYLETLEIAELQQICIDRGFDILPRHGNNNNGIPQQSLERADYLEAARRCLSLENEMNAILAANPDLAAELEAEIARMQRNKERLEAERERLLAEKADLEQKLAQAGMSPNQVESHPKKTKPSSSSSNSMAFRNKLPEDMTLREVFLESFLQLYDRVRKDMELIWRILHPILRPMGGALRLLWRHLQPQLRLLWRYIQPQLVQLQNEIIHRARQIFFPGRTNDNQEGPSRMETKQISPSKREQKENNY